MLPKLGIVDFLPEFQNYNLLLWLFLPLLHSTFRHSVQLESYSMKVKMASPCKVYIEASNVRVVNIKSEGYVTYKVSPSVMPDSPPIQDETADQRSNNVWDRLYYNTSSKRKRTNRNEQPQMKQSFSKFYEHNDAETNENSIEYPVSSNVSNKTGVVFKHNLVKFDQRKRTKNVIFRIFFDVFKSAFLFLVAMLLLLHALSLLPNVEQTEINGISGLRSIKDLAVRRSIVSLASAQINKNSCY